MKKYILIAYLMSGLSVYSQNGYVEYGYIESLGLGNAQGLDYNAVLLFDKFNSNYVTGKESLEKIEKLTERKIVEVNGEVQAVFNGMGVSKEGNQVYFSNKDKSMLSTLYFKEMIHINDGNVNVKWEIGKDTKKIGSFICTIATTTFRGRDYTAWFTKDIPVPFGPWKLNGLPGLILEAYDQGKFVYWYFKNIEYPTSKTVELKINSDIKSNDFIDYTDYKKLQEMEMIKAKEKNAILMKDMPGIEITSPKLNELFIECE